MAVFNECMPAGQEETPEILSFERRGVQRKMATFPMILHYMLSELEKDNLGHLMSWQPHGRSFIVRNPKQVEKTIIPLYVSLLVSQLFLLMSSELISLLFIPRSLSCLHRWFRQSKFTSFQRQLNFYGFTRITTGMCLYNGSSRYNLFFLLISLAPLSLLGPNVGGYFLKLFLRGNASLAERIGRTIIKGKHSRTLNFAGSEPDVEAISALRSEGCESSDTKGLGTSKNSINPTIAIAAEAADPYFPLPTLVQSGRGLNIDCPEGNHRQRAMALLACHIVRNATLAPTNTVKEAINHTPMTRQSSQLPSGHVQVTAGHLKQHEQVQREHYTMQAHEMAYLRTEVMRIFLTSAATVPAAAGLEEFERLRLRPSDRMYEDHQASLSMNNKIGFLSAGPFSPGRSGFL